MNLSSFISNYLQTHSSLTFADFMQMALYDPQSGYYTTGIETFGQDFTTAPQISPLFGACLANQCATVLQALTHPVILEFGAGSGRLCVDILTQLEALNCLPDAYLILEVSGRLQAQQRQTLEQEIPHLLPRIQWIETWPSAAFEGVMLANEVLDAMPVHRFLQSESDLYELHVAVTADGQLCEVLKLCENERLAKQVKKVVSPELHPYQSEVNLWVIDWLQRCAEILSRGIMLIVDYGFPAAEYYHPDRDHGTVMCHYRHRAHPNPLLNVGLQDITAHVDFTHVAEAAVDAGFAVAGYTSQAAFLLATNLLAMVNAEDPIHLFKQQQAVKLLTLPSEMGELFKVMALSRAWDEPLQGFQLHDRRAGL